MSTGEKWAAAVAVIVVIGIVVVLGLVLAAKVTDYGTVRAQAQVAQAQAQQRIAEANADARVEQTRAFVLGMTTVAGMGMAGNNLLGVGVCGFDVILLAAVLAVWLVGRYREAQP